MRLLLPGIRKSSSQQSAVFRAGLGILLLVVAAQPAVAVPSYVEKTVAQMKATLEPDRPSVRKLVIAPSPTQGETPAHLVAREVQKTLKDGKRTLTVFLEPDIVKGFAVLTWERPDKPAAIWLYLPLVHRMYKDIDLGSVPLLYTELTFADIAPMDLSATQVTLLGTEKHAGTRTFKLREVPRRQRPWAYSLSWMATDSNLPLEREYYDANDTLVRTKRFEDVNTIDGVATPQRIRVDDKVENRHTEILVAEVHYDVDIPDSLFDPSKFTKVADNPFWQSLPH